jgi:hypothetical protein
VALSPTEWCDATRDVDVTAERDDLTRSTRRGIDRRIALLPPQDVTDVAGLRVTTQARTAVDIARHFDRALAVQLINWLLTHAQTTYDDLRAVCDRKVRVPGVRVARSAIDSAAVGVDSPPETSVRLQITDAGLPLPDVRLTIVEHDAVQAIGDLGYWRWLIWMEYDSWEWHRSRRAGPHSCDVADAVARGCRGASVVAARRLVSR